MDNKRQPLILILLFVFVPVSSALGERPNSGPSSVSVKSAEVLRKKIKLFEYFVDFRRSYIKMDLRISARRTAAGHKEGFVLIIAVVPKDQLSLWSENMEEIDTPDISWLRKRRWRIDYSNISKWYRINTITVGIDSENSIVVYYNDAFRISGKSR